MNITMVFVCFLLSSRARANKMSGGLGMDCVGGVGGWWDRLYSGSPDCASHVQANALVSLRPCTMALAKQEKRDCVEVE